jgi:HD-like signal output (HDOD) protein
MNGRSISELIEEKLDNGGIELPVFNPIALKVQRLVSDENCGAKDFAKIIEKDQTLTSLTLKTANCSFYTGLRPIKTIQEATVRLGAKSLLNLVMTVTQSQAYRLHKRELARWMSPLWNHALATAAAARWLAIHLGLDRLSEEGFLAGLLHDIGKLLLLRVVEDLQESGSSEHEVSDGIIHDILEGMHCHCGERLMRHLNMPDAYCKAVGSHHERETGEDLLLNLVRLANLTCHKLGIGLTRDQDTMLSTTPEAIRLMASDLLLAELQVYLGEYSNSINKFLDAKSAGRSISRS